MSTDLAPTPVDEVKVMDTLRVSDRCDTRNCAAQAYVRVSVGGSTLDFCAHHHREAEAGLAAAGATVVVDDRKQLEHRPGASV